MRPSGVFTAAVGASRSIHGVRAAESGERSLSAAVHGVATNRTCRPILRWTGPEVFAFLEQAELPVHPSYAMLGGGRWNRDRIRVGTLCGVRGGGIGRAEWEQEYYGDVVRRLQKAQHDSMSRKRRIESVQQPSGE